MQSRQSMIGRLTRRGTCRSAYERDRVRSLWRRRMKSKRFAATLRVFGWMAFYLLLSAPAIILADQGQSNSFVIRGVRVFDGRKVLEQNDVWVEGGKIKAVGK